MRLANLLVQRGQAVEELGRVRIDRQSPLINGPRFVVLALADKGVPQAEIGLDIARVFHDDLPEGADSALVVLVGNGAPGHDIEAILSQ